MIYFVQIENDGPVKIGYAADVKRRVRSVAHGLPYKLMLLGYIKGTRSLERTLHKQIGLYRMRGEWFHPTKEVMECIATYVPHATTKQWVGAGLSVGPLHESDVPKLEQKRLRRVAIVKAVQDGETLDSVAERFFVTKGMVAHCCRIVGVKYTRKNKAAPRPVCVHEDIIKTVPLVVTKTVMVVPVVIATPPHTSSKPKNKTREERRTDMVEAVLAGAFTHEVAERFGVSWMTVERACAEFGVSPINN